MRVVSAILFGTALGNLVMHPHLFTSLASLITLLGWASLAYLDERKKKDVLLWEDDLEGYLG